MNTDNNANRIRKRLMIEVARLIREGRIVEDIDRMPVNLFPRRGQSVRCCIHKDRAVTKYRLMALLGHSVEDETDELKPLAEYAVESLERETPVDPILTVIDEACSACLKGRHYVTNVCKGCVARPCTVNCPKDAIQVVNGQARIDENKCVNCGKCVGVCPYHAIVYVPVPCEEACPVGAIAKDESGREHIDHEDCIHCGKCMIACPFAAIMERSQMVDVLRRIGKERKVVAMLAPAIAGQFPTDFGKVVTAVRSLGFNDVVEVALGADMTARHEAAELSERLEGGAAFMTTSCCPAYVRAAERHIPGLAEYVSETPTPMHYIAELVKRDDPEAITVFVGPCVAKRNEALGDPAVDYVLTAEELGAMFVAWEIEVDECETGAFDQPAHAGGRGFPVSGGVTAAVQEYLGGDITVTPVLVDGLDKKSIRTLGTYPKGKCPGNFVEVMSCEGGCVGGPCVINSTRAASRRIETYREDAVVHDTTPE